MPWAPCLGWVGLQSIEPNQVIEHHYLQEGINGIENQEFYGRKADWVETKGFRKLFLVLSGPSRGLSLPSRTGGVSQSIVKEGCE